MATPEKPKISASVAVFWRQINPSDSLEVLLTLRPHGRVFAGYWEFPGGKIEAGESAEQALQRECLEELGVKIEKPIFAFTHQHDYPHAEVHLSFFTIALWHGDFVLKEHDGMAWQKLKAITLSPLLPANLALIETINDCLRS